ncbi:telomere repeat-binding protein 3-like isoform X2 [Salvia hispanica]|uniref:telomere repeat-binding protein 3-like isoform X2 n=1 Tax=Salvia hispanica TaxID=49212 RepID=UPI002009AE42|nr:telomere repeat-binding protein 3-like isoform X2 [Salvia hispanica]
MVLKRRLEYGFNGYRGPVIPRAPRSIRKRGPRKKTVEDSQLCAFELLAAVAGKLLLENESSASSNVAEVKSQPGSSRGRNEKVQPKDDKALKSESFDHGSCAESAFVPKISVEEGNLLFNCNGIPQAENDQVVEQTAVRASSDFQQKLHCDIKLGSSEDKSLDENGPCKIESSNCIGESLNSKVESGSEVQSQDDKNQIGHLSMANTSTVNDPIGEYVNTYILSNPESSVKFPLYRDSKPDALLKNSYNNVKLGSRDDDENSFRCKKSSTKSRPLRPQPRSVRHRMRKMMASKCWKAAPKQMDHELYNTCEGMKSFYRYRKSMYTRERCQQAPLKKRKLFDRSFGVTIDREESSDSIYNLPEKASGASVKGHTKAKDPQVTFSIKSFKIPELYIDVPETTTVGSLKRTVVDAVAAILGGGIRVGVVFQGKKVRDDERTLQQAGISQCANPDNLGFILEPSFTHVSPSEILKKLPVLSPRDSDKPLPRWEMKDWNCLTFGRSPISPMAHSGVSNASMDPLLVTKSDNVDNNEFILSPTTPDNMQTDGAVLNSKALIPVPSTNVEALAVVPANLKPKRSEISQRRTRRPFSVTEVEALVEAVETLGTGRWRDVKMRAFEDADHRTYVDLKDKWKTLVHTASISSQQRRGEPVPQELLDRVLSAHSYWSQNQSRQHGKHPVDPFYLDSREGIVGA